ncbi:unnamed protein product [Lathyrus sativus]|nr:unnamed protein product [Lathyrus sativus]
MVLFKKKYSDMFMEHETDDKFAPKIGFNHQTEIPLNLSDSEEDVYDTPVSSAICFPVTASWSDADAESLVLALFLFDKNFTQINKFLENKGMEEIISFYYGRFYKTDGYRRWSECRNLKGRKCIISKKLSTKMRQNDLLSRLILHVSKESRHTLLQVSKSYVEGKTCLEEYISSISSIVGLGVFAQALGIGKENGVLTRSDLETTKNSCGEVSAPACKSLSSLGPDDIIQSLMGGIQLSKTRSNELFWEAIWPRLLARGWHSEQTKNQDYLFFLTPGVKKFSRRKHVKGKHYFDSVKDVLSKVVAEPNIIVLEEEVKEGGSNEDDFSDDDDHHKCYIKDHTSLVHGRKPSDLRELKYVGNRVHTVEADVDGKIYKGHKYTKRVHHSKDMYERKLLKVKENRYPPLELEDATMTIKHELNWRVGLGDSNEAAVPTKRRRLTGCAKAENSRFIENSSGGLRSDKVGFSQSSSFLDANRNVCDPVSHQQNGSSTILRFHRSSHNDSFQCMSVSCVFSIPQVPLKSQNSKTMGTTEEGEQGLRSATEEVIEEPLELRSATEEEIEEPLEQSRRRQSSRNSKLSVKANEFWHAQKRQKKNDIIFNPCRKARTRGKTRPR